MRYPDRMMEHVPPEKIWDSRWEGERQVERMKEFIAHDLSLVVFQREQYLPYGMGLKTAGYDKNSTRNVCVLVLCLCSYVWCHNGCLV